MNGTDPTSFCAVQYRTQQPDGPEHAPLCAPRRGAVLIVVLWILIVLSLLVGTLAFEMHVESNITSYYRKRVKAQYVAQAGIEWAKLMMLKAGTFSDDLEDEFRDLYLTAMHLNRGLAVTGFRHQLGEGEFQLDLVPEQGRRNVNRLTEDDWREILDQSWVPEEKWDELIDAFFDWTDTDEAHRVNGAESDDEFYEDRGYEVKNGPLDTVDELLLIKGFTPRIVYGGPAEHEDDPPLTGFASLLTAWGDGRVNVNAASRDVLLTLPEMDELAVDAILDGRAGIDGIAGTEDDGFSSVQEVLAVTGLSDAVGTRITTTERRFIRVVSIGEVQGVKAGIWAIFRQQGNNLLVVYWREESMH